MKLNYESLGQYIKVVNCNNKEKELDKKFLRGINIHKKFMPSVANTTDLDLSKYKIVNRGQFAFNPMHVGRDRALPIGLLMDEEIIIVSPAYTVFEVIDEDKLHPEYLFMWFNRDEFDRRAWFTTDNSIRGGFSWDSLCEMKIPLPLIDDQINIVGEYNAIMDRIKLNNEMNKKLEGMASLIRTMNFN